MSQNNQEAITHVAHEIVELAQRCGLVVTIEIKPREPLAMGNYDMVVDAREARVMAKPIVRSV